jgi:hypothetical protein
LKEEVLDRTLWRTCFGRGYGPVVRQTAEWNEAVLKCLICSDLKKESESASETRYKTRSWRISMITDLTTMYFRQKTVHKWIHVCLPSY